MIGILEGLSMLVVRGDMRSEKGKIESKSIELLEVERKAIWMSPDQSIIWPIQRPCLIIEYHLKKKISKQSRS